MSFITIENDGAELLKSNYWESEYNKAGYYYVSINAGCFRMLVPQSREVTDLPEMKTGKWAEISKLEYEKIDSNKAMFKILFDDKSETPWCLDLSQEQFDRLPLPEDYGKEFRLAVYTKSGKALEMKCLLK